MANLPENAHWELDRLARQMQNAIGPIHSVDDDILSLLGLAEETANDIVVGRETVNKLAGRTYIHPAPITASVDAALALFGTAREGWAVESMGADAMGYPDTIDTMGWTVEITNGPRLVQAQARTLPIALCLAMVRSIRDEVSG